MSQQTRGLDNGRFGYSEEEWAILRTVANRLTGEPDVNGLIHALGAEDQQDLCQKRGCVSLLGLFLQGDFFDNIDNLEREIRSSSEHPS